MELRWKRMFRRPWLAAIPAWALLGALVLAACAGPTPTPTTPPGPGPQFTSPPETAAPGLTPTIEVTSAAQATFSAGSTAVAQLTQIAAEQYAAGLTVAAQTPLPPTATSLPTEPPTATPVPPTPTPTIPCNLMGFEQDVTVTPGSFFITGARFIKTWRVRNLGSCPWTGDYALVFFDGYKMDGPGVASLPLQVLPGDAIDLSILLTAPGAAGEFTGLWMLRDPNNNLFGAGEAANQPLRVQIRAISRPQPHTLSYDFTANYCAAAWRSQVGALPCPGAPQDPNGSVIMLTQPALESRQENDLALWMKPDASNNGTISGIYPSYIVQAGDHFRSEVGCLLGAAGCDLTFRLDYRGQNGLTGNLGTWREVYDGSTTSIDIDLSNWVDQRVQFILGVEENGAFQSADGFWFLPRIENPQQAGVILTWTQDTGEPGGCHEVRVFLDEDENGWAQARSCTGASPTLGQVMLTEAERRQLLGWIAELKDFQAEVYRASTPRNVISFINFNGAGQNDARDPDIQAINNFAETLFNLIVS